MTKNSVFYDEVFFEKGVKRIFSTETQKKTEKWSEKNFVKDEEK